MSEQDTDHRMVGVNSATDGVLDEASRIQQLFAKNEPKHQLEKNQDIGNSFSLRQVFVNTAPTPEPPNGTLRFFDFPSEIGNMIYRYVVSFPKGVVKTNSLSPHLNIFLANRRSFAEASTLFYALNTFILYSCYTLLDSDPFGTRRLDRIQRCLLHLSSTQNHRNAFLFWFNKTFVDALTTPKKHSLKFLIIRVTMGQLSTLEPLLLSGSIEYAQVDLGWPPSALVPEITGRPHLARNEWMGLYLDRWEGNREGLKCPSQQMVERVLMCEGSPTRWWGGGETTCEINDVISRGYVCDPALAVGLETGRLREAREKGGWRGNFELYDFLGVERHRWIRVGVSEGELRDLRLLKMRTGCPRGNRWMWSFRPRALSQP
ncbi:hypothetical protein Q9189_003854 [Teloschistes chrysophthalmus]